MSKKSIKYRNMAQKRTSTAKSSAKSTKTRSSAGTSKSTNRRTTGKTTVRRKSYKKSKSKIPAYKMMVYCALGISLCILAYLVADIALKTPSVIDAPSVTERFEEPEKKVETVTVPKTETKKPEKKPEVKKTETPKSVAETVKKVEPPKTEAKPAQKPAPAAKPKPETVESVKPVEAPKKNTKSAYNFPAAKNGAKIAFLLDDGGQNMAHLEKFVTLPFPITVAVLPQLAHSVEAGARVRSSGNELMLHQPMQSVNASVNPGPGAIIPSMSDEEIISTLFFNVNQIGPVAGINNHEGSAITADAEKMAVVMKFTSEEGLYFLDSRTNVETKVPYVAEALGYSYYERNIFLDNEKTRDNVLKELNKGLKYANQNGQAIMIAHVWSADFLPELLKEIYPELESKGYKIVTVSQCSKKY